MRTKDWVLIALATVYGLWNIMESTTATTVFQQMVYPLRTLTWIMFLMLFR